MAFFSVLVCLCVCVFSLPSVMHICIKAKAGFRIDEAIGWQRMDIHVYIYICVCVCVEMLYKRAAATQALPAFHFGSSRVNSI